MTVNKRSLLVFILGVSSGFFAMYLVLFLTGMRVTRPTGRQSSQTFLPNSPHSAGENDDFSGPDQEQRWDDFQENNHHAHEEDAVAKDLKKHVRVLCWVMTSPSNLQSKARHVKATWGRRCNKLLFMSSQQEDTLPAVGLPVEEGREHLWRKTKEAFKYIYAHHMDDADWFLKADDDTYVILENLRLLLRDYDPMRLLYLGRRFKPYIKQGYMSGGAGYVLSKAAVRRLVEQGLGDRNHCRQDDGGAEDLELGMCLQHVGVTIIDSRDSNGRETFHPFLPEYHLIPGMVPQDTWYWEYNYYPATAGPGCCSDFAITFHYVPPNMMYVFEYFIYHLKPFGIESRIVLPSAKYRPEVNNQKQPDRSSQAAKQDPQYSQLSQLSRLSSNAGHATTKVLATGVEQPQSKHKKFHFKDLGIRKRVKLLPKFLMATMRSTAVAPAATEGRLADDSDLSQMLMVPPSPQARAHIISDPEGGSDPEILKVVPRDWEARMDSLLEFKLQRLNSANIGSKKRPAPVEIDSDPQDVSGDEDLSPDQESSPDPTPRVKKKAKKAVSSSGDEFTKASKKVVKKKTKKRKTKKRKKDSSSDSSSDLSSMDSDSETERAGLFAKIGGKVCKKCAKESVDNNNDAGNHQRTPSSPLKSSQSWGNSSQG